MPPSATRQVELEVVVMDDGSTDGTDALVLALARQDTRVRLERAPPLPAGWNGKQHACWAARPRRPQPHSLLCRRRRAPRPRVHRPHGSLPRIQRAAASSAAFPGSSPAHPWSGSCFPSSTSFCSASFPSRRCAAEPMPAFAAGCGQFMMVRADDYFACGGHSGIRLTMHDGLRLPRSSAKPASAPISPTSPRSPPAACTPPPRRSGAGLAKNATEGLAAPARIVPDLPPVSSSARSFPSSCSSGSSPASSSPTCSAWQVTGAQAPCSVRVLAVLSLVAVFGAWLPRILAVSRFRQDWRSAVLAPRRRPPLCSAVQWYGALGRRARAAVPSAGRIAPTPETECRASSQQLRLGSRCPPDTRFSSAGR